MQELRFVAVSEDGRYAVLAVPGRSARFTLPIDERLRAVALGQTSRLAQYEIEVESPLRPKEIQARIRAGETVEEIADAAGIAVERVRWFEGPVLAERAYIADQAQASSVRRPGESTPGPRLGEITTERLSAVGADPDDVQWDARKRADGNWQVLLTFTSGGRYVAEWMFDPRRRHVIPVDDNAARMSLPDVELPVLPSPGHGEATVTRLEPRFRHEPPAAMHAAPPQPVPQPVAQAASQPVPQSVTQPVAQQPEAAVSAPVSAPSSPTVPSPAPEPVVAPPTVREPVLTTPVAAHPPVAEPAAVEPAIVAPVAEPAIVAPVAEPAIVAPVPTAPEAAQSVISEPAAADVAAPSEPTVREVAASAQPQQPAPAPVPDSQPAPASNGPEPAARPGRKNARGRRSSVPSWDEIMLGSSRQQD